MIFLTLILLLTSCGPVLIVKDPLNAEESFQLGYIYHLESNHKSAIYHYKRSIKKNPKNWQAYYNLGTLYATLGDFESAKKALNRALELNDSPSIRNNLAYTHFMLGDICEALWHFQMGNIQNQELFRALKPHEESCLHWKSWERTDSRGAF